MKAPLRVVLGSGLIESNHVGVRHELGGPAGQVLVSQLNTPAPWLQGFHVVRCPVDMLGFIHAFAKTAIQRQVSAVFLREGHVRALHRSIPVKPEDMAGVWRLCVRDAANRGQQRINGGVHPHVVGTPTGVGQEQGFFARLHHEIQ